MTAATDATATVAHPAPWADRIGRGIMAVNAAAALLAFASGLMIMASVSDERVITEAWRTFAYIFFAGIWVILTVSPRRQKGLWELLLFQKGAITAYSFVMWHLPDAPLTALIDLAVTGTTLIAYVLCRGWLAWRTSSPEPANGGRPTVSAG
jgi:hypothetical protein